MLNGEIFYSVSDAQIIIEERRKHFNTKRPNIVVGYRPKVLEAIITMDKEPIMHSKSIWPSQMGLLNDLY